VQGIFSQNMPGAYTTFRTDRITQMIQIKSSRVRRGNQTRLIPLTEPYVRASYTAPVYSRSNGNRNKYGKILFQVLRKVLNALPIYPSSAS